MIRFATIGTGFIVDWFLAGISFCQDMEYAAVYSRNMHTGMAFADKYHVKKIYDNLEELAMDESIDAVYIASPPSCHFQQAMMMLNYGKHVLCEKPAMSNSKELELIRKAAKDNGVLFMEAMKNVHTPGFQMIQEHLPELGKIRNVFLQKCRYSSSYARYQHGILDHVFLPKLSNGALMDIGCYAVHFLSALFGMPKSIQANGILLSNGIDSAGSILADYGSMQAEIVYSKMFDTMIPSQIQGEEGCMIIPDLSHPREFTISYRDGRKEVYRVPGIPAENGRNNLIYEILAFERFVNEGKMDAFYDKAMIVSERIMDKARQQMGILFPADKIMEV